MKYNGPSEVFSLQKTTAQTQSQINRFNTPNNMVWRNDVHFGGFIKKLSWGLFLQTDQNIKNIMKTIRDTKNFQRSICRKSVKPNRMVMTFEVHEAPQRLKSLLGHF
jgi:hypothetical protein